MKFKMAQNSLFAVLLRSPWWISLGLVALITLVSFALLPPQFVGFGVMGALPFLVITGMAAWRQRHAPDPAVVALALQQAAALSWKAFSQQVEHGFMRQGYTVTRLSTGAADFQLTQAERVTLVSCKRWKAASHGVDALRELAAAKNAQGAQQALFISLGTVTPQAQQFAQAQGIWLMTEQELAQLLNP
jgi:restriction system protein